MAESTSRLEAFSDGVFAIAITLLILEIRLPHTGAEGSLAESLRSLWPSYAAFALSFFVNLPSSSPVAPINDTVRGGQIEAISPTGDLTSIPSLLQWRAVPGAASYEIRLMDVAEEILWQTSATAPLVQLPAEAQALMTERKTLTWRIRAMDANGVIVAASAVETFRVITR